MSDHTWHRVTEQEPINWQAKRVTAPSREPEYEAPKERQSKCSYRPFPMRPLPNNPNWTLKEGQVFGHLTLLGLLDKRQMRRQGMSISKRKSYVVLHCGLCNRYTFEGTVSFTHRLPYGRCSICRYEKYAKRYDYRALKERGEEATDMDRRNRTMKFLRSRISPDDFARKFLEEAGE